MTSSVHVSELIAKAARLQQADNAQDAEALYDEALRHDPACPEALNFKGMTAAESGRHVEAIGFFDRAIQAQIAAEPLFNKGLSLVALKDDATALKVFEQVATSYPTHAGAQIYRTTLLHKMGRIDAALEAARDMTTHCPADERGFYNLSFLSLSLRRHEEAHIAAERARALSPTSPKILGLCAEVAFARNEFGSAAALSQEALSLDPTLASAHRVLGDVAMRDRRFDHALKHYQQSLSLNPGLAETRANYALLLANLGRHTEAAAEYLTALRLQPENAAARDGLALALLTMGDLTHGWPLYTQRKVAKDQTQNPSRRPLMFAPPRPGEALRLTCDQGVGEQILFSGLLPDLFLITQDVELRCDERLHPLLTRSFPAVRYLSLSAKSWDLSGTLADVARWLRPNFASFPRHEGYLKADPEKRNILRKRYESQDRRPIVGLSWMTSPSVKFSGPKTIPLQMWAPLLCRTDARFVSLQYGDIKDELDAANMLPGVEVRLDDSINPEQSLDDFAAQVAAMDFVITTSNTTAHVAGALNVPAVVLVPLGFGGLWHWFLEREDSPWYPSVRIIRQSTRGNWGDVLERASHALEDFIAAHRSS